MSYLEYNKIVFKYYLQRTSSKFINLSIDESEYNEIISNSNLSNFLPPQNWNALLETIDSIPLYFGIISLQCLAASLMEKDEHHAADAYQIRLKSILKIDYDNELQIKFKGSNPSKPIQEEIWHEAKRYLKEEHNLILEIPDRREHAGRYVQYPKSQSLLNSEDLKYFTVFFNEEFQIKEEINFPYFEKCLNSRLRSLCISNRAQLLLDDSLKRQLCIYQVFNYYCNWDGNVYNFEKSKNYDICSPKENTGKYLKLILLFEKDQPIFYLNETIVDFNKVFQTSNYFKFHSFKKMIIFNEIDDCPNEYENSRFIYLDTQCYILFDENLRSGELETVKRNNICKFEFENNLVLYKLNLSENLQRSNLAEYIHAPHPIKFNGGIRLNRKNEYLQGYGPQIRSNTNYTVISDNKITDFSPEESPGGLYKIRIDYYPDVELRIIDKQERANIVNSKGKGWDLKYLSINEKYNLEGLMKVSDYESNDSLIREWIKININSGYKKKYTGKNLLIKAIANSKI